MLGKIGSFVGELLQVVIFAISVFLFVYLLVMQPHKIKGDSMEPNFHNGQYLLTDKISYRLGEPTRGDVVVFRAPPDYRDEFIKRIIALPGDKVKVEGGKIYVNNRLLEESYIPNDFVTRSAQFSQEGREITVPEGEFFVVGDNRDHSLDSRVFGTVEKQYITGRAWIIYWPLNEFGAIKSPTYIF